MMEREKYKGFCPYTEDTCLYDYTEDTDCCDCCVFQEEAADEDGAF